jgi:mRNA interferase YafQ
MYQIIYSQKYQKAFRKIQRAGKYDLSKLEIVLQILQSGKVLPPQYQNHYLRGKLQEYEECHIYDDLLLIYKRDKKLLLLLLLDLGTHSQLF